MKRNEQRDVGDIGFFVKKSSVWGSQYLKFYL